MRTLPLVTNDVRLVNRYEQMMSAIPAICIESTNVESEENVCQEVQSQPGWLSVPDMNYADQTDSNMGSHYRNSDNCLDITLGCPSAGTLYITTITKDKKTSLQNELVWVQIYQRIPSIGSRLNTCQREVTTYLMCYSCSNPRTLSSGSPDLCTTPLLCINLKHTKMVPLDSKRFNIITRNGECCFVQAEIPPNTDMDYWVELLQPARGCDGRRGSSSEYVPIIRSAPGSPEPRRRKYLNTNDTNHIVFRSGSSDPLKEIEEAENE